MKSEETLIEREFRANTYDIDFAGVLSNQVYQRWLEDLRTDLIQGYADMKELMDGGSVPVLARTEVDFKRPVFLLERIKGKMWVEELQGVKWAVRAEFIKEDGTVCARSYQWGVFLDTKTLRPVQVPDVLPRVSPEES
ncbi:MAG: acyl-CoA thioesterase [Candidatus Thermoplasmatota archaeon]|nr:acyl-CoA thioesterase [Candidatus Thermoplasmatota archaeon]